MDRAAGCQTDRWCADNAVSLEQCTKALRAGQEIHLAERWERDGGEDLSEWELRKRKKEWRWRRWGVWYSSLRGYSLKSRDGIDPQTEHWVNIQCLTYTTRQAGSHVAQNDRLCRHAAPLPPTRLHSLLPLSITWWKHLRRWWGTTVLRLSWLPLETASPRTSQPVVKQCKNSVAINVRFLEPSLCTTLFFFLKATLGNFS